MRQETIALLLALTLAAPAAAQTGCESTGSLVVWDPAMEGADDGDVREYGPVEGCIADGAVAVEGMDLAWVEGERDRGNRTLHLAEAEEDGAPSTIGDLGPGQRLVALSEDAA